MIKGLHHNAYRCRDSEETRRFYEDFLGLPLSGSLEIGETKTGRKTAVRSRWVFRIVPEFLPTQKIAGRRDWTRTNDPHHVKVVL